MPNRIYERVATLMATFTPKNFPREGNEKFPGAGERTTYAPTTENGNYKWSDGFPLANDAVLFSKDKRRFNLKKGNKVYFTYPAKLYSATDIGVASRGNYALVSTKSHKDEPEGYVSISSVIKPAGSAQNRVAAGSATQNLIANKVEEIAFNLGKNYEFVSTARIGSTAPDLIVSIDGVKIQFEIKGTNSSTTSVTFFDKSINRRTAPPEIIEDIASAYISNLKFVGKPVSTLMTNMKFKQNFIGLIDFYRQYNNKYGLAGDEGAPKSGFLPIQLTTTDKTILTKMRSVIIDHFAKGKDNYFVIHNRSNDNLQMYFTGFGKNTLDLPMLPEFKSFALQTYGGTSSGSTRVGLKIKI
jgi:hypothetical protein